jgi:hypothetical protein
MQPTEKICPYYNLPTTASYGYEASSRLTGNAHRSSDDTKL